MYILGPDLFSRFVVSQFAPARPRNISRSEEVTRAVLLSSIPVVLVWLVVHYGFHRLSSVSVLRDFLLGLYGEQSLAKNSDVFFPAALKIIRVNVEIMLLPVYALVLVWSLFLGCLIRRYGRLLRKNQKSPFVLSTLTWLVKPWVAEWHLKLSGALLPNKTDYIRVDVLTKLDVLFRGTLSDHQLASDGSLVNITLSDPQKFRRQELLRDRLALGPLLEPDSSQYWSPIEARSFIVMASEIVTLNLNYVDPSSLKKKPRKLTAAGAGKALAAVNASKKSDSHTLEPNPRIRRKRKS